MSTSGLPGLVTLAALLHKLLGPFLRAREVRRAERELAQQLRDRRRTRSPSPPLSSLATLDDLQPSSELVNHRSAYPGRPPRPDPILTAVIDFVSCLPDQGEETALDLEVMRQTPLGQAVQDFLVRRYPCLGEYQSLVLAEVVELARSGPGRDLLRRDPPEFLETAVKRAVLCLAEIRVAIKRAAREELLRSQTAAQGQVHLPAASPPAAG